MHFCKPHHPECKNCIFASHIIRSAKIAFLQAASSRSAKIAFLQATSSGVQKLHFCKPQMIIRSAKITFLHFCKPHHPECKNCIFASRIIIRSAKIAFLECKNCIFASHIIIRSAKIAFLQAASSGVQKLHFCKPHHPECKNCIFADKSAKIKFLHSGNCIFARMKSKNKIFCTFAHSQK